MNRKITTSAAAALILAGATVQPALASNWVMYSTDARTPMLVDTDSIKSQGNVRYAWSAMPSGRTNQKDYYAVNCADNTFTIKYSEVSIGSYRRAFPATSETWIEVKQGSMFANFVKLVCNWPTPGN